MRYGNPNTANAPMQPVNYGQQRPTPPMGYAGQREQMGTQQPNTMGGPTNTARYGTLKPPAPPLNPTPVAPTPTPVNPVASMWWLPQNQPAGYTGGAYTLPNGTVVNPNAYAGSQQNAANMDAQGNYVNPTTGLNQWAAPQQQQSFGPQQQMGNPWGGGMNPMADRIRRFTGY